MRTDNRDKYFYWLLDKIGIKAKNPKYYTRVLKMMYDKAFYWLVPMDENRQSDGLYLRKRYLIDEIPFKVNESDIFKGNEYCSILEMMVALAQRMESDFMHDPTLGDRSGEWFWIMMHNLGLDEMDNDEFDEKVADDILNRFLKRAYESDGTGGLFVTENEEIDLKNVEIWTQMNMFIEEKFLAKNGEICQKF